MEDITAYQNEIDAIVAARGQSEAELERLDREAAPAYEALGRKAYELVGFLPAEQRNQLATEMVRVDEYASKIAGLRQGITRGAERVDELEQLIRAEQERAAREAEERERAEAAAREAESVAQSEQTEQIQPEADQAAEAKAPVDDDARICPVCGERILKNFRFCPGCAGKVEELFPPEQPAVPPVTHKECPQCHKQWDDEMNFCADCGVPLIEVRG
ncbi:zinc ribbon domain-containing protein [Enorma phocaeensis]|uniref:zinc ribbon domain-containing protein n=1 Tax=Enorma phocaeensis TaxID=1871019 RepID=UPI0023530F95|nr:zinc ribbon domain-containing protein [Enorma phocaeensis]